MSGAKMAHTAPSQHQRTLGRTAAGEPQNGIFIQSTAATADADPNSSDEIFVFMGRFSDLISPRGAESGPASRPEWLDLTRVRGLGKRANFVLRSKVGGHALFELQRRLVGLAHEDGLAAVRAGRGAIGFEDVAAKARDGHERGSWGRVPLSMSLVIALGDGSNARGIPFGSCDIAHRPPPGTGAAAAARGSGGLAVSDAYRRSISNQTFVPCVLATPQRSAS
jgi:hypothetical protein